MQKCKRNSFFLLFSPYFQIQYLTINTANHSYFPRILTNLRMRSQRNSIIILQMQEESPLPCTPTPHTQLVPLLLRSKDSRTRIIKCLHEALSALNLPASVRALEQESRLLMQEERLRIIRSHLRGFEYEQACEQVMQLELPARLKQEIVRDLMDLQLDYWLSRGEEETVLQKLWQREVSAARRLQLCEMIALGTYDVQVAKLERAHELILQRCEQEGKERFNVRKVLANFLDTHDPLGSRSTSAPSTLVAESQAIILGRKRVNFVKLNQGADRIALLIEGESEFGLSVFAVTGSTIKKELSLMGDGLGWVTQMKWSRFHLSQQECIAICSYERVIVISAGQELRITLNIQRKKLSIGRLLCFEWHPISEILYIGGLFDKILGFDSAGQLATELNPFCKVRQMVFSPTGKLFTIGATKHGHLLRYCVEEERIQAKFSPTTVLFMDLKYSDGLLLATTKEFVYVIDAQTMTVVNLIGAPPNQRLYKIQAFLCNSWVLVFNQTLRGVRQEGGVLMRSKWHNCEAVDVVRRKMVTFHTSLRLWDSQAQPSKPRKPSQEVDEYSTPHRPVQPMHPHSPSSSSSSSSSESMEIEEMEEQESSESEYEYEEMVELPLFGNSSNSSLI